MAHVRRELIGDRFLADGSGRWIDLVTGRTTDVIVRSVESEWLATEWPGIEARLREEYYSSRAVRLIDFGLVNTTQWFEARATAPVRAVGRGAVLNKGAMEAVVAAAEAASPGVRYVPIVVSGSGMSRMAGTMARRLRRLGYITIRADLEIPLVLRSALTHRHLVVQFRSERNPPPVIRWIRDLADVSPRSHLVVEMTRIDASQLPQRAGPNAPRIACGVFGSDLMSTASWKARVVTTAEKAHAFMDWSRLEPAQALLASVNAEAAVRRVQSPRAIDLVWARLRRLQGRNEDARRLAAGLATERFGERMDASGSSDSGAAATGSRR